MHTPNNYITTGELECAALTEGDVCDIELKDLIQQVGFGARVDILGL